MEDVKNKMDTKHENKPELQSKRSTQINIIKSRDDSITFQKNFFSQIIYKVKKRCQKLTYLHASPPERFTKSIRRAGHAINNFRHIVVWLAQVAYDTLPLSRPIKNRITDFVFTSFGPLFRGTDSYVLWKNIKDDASRIECFNEKSDNKCYVQIENYLEKVPNSAIEVSEVIFGNPIAPIVSIVIPVFNNWRYTYACLRAICERSGNDISYEVIIANDASTDETLLMLQRIVGIRKINNLNNLGFLRNCNNAAKYARGKYIVFLNNDTEVQDNWLYPMLNLFEKFNNVGLVGCQLLFPNGKVQEAGGIILQNGWGHPYGQGECPSYYEFNYVKEVDCITGACLMVKKDLFLSLGGFDESFAPAFYEEFDFAFTLRKECYKVMYQPASKIMHYGSSSYGIETRNHRSIINHQIFCRKWQNALRDQAGSKDGYFLARDRSYNKKIILMIDDKVPEYDRNAGGLTTYQYLELFCDMGFKVVLIPNDLTLKEPYTTNLQQLGIEIIYGEVDIREWLTCYGRNIHYIWLARPRIATEYIDLVKTSTIGKILYYTHDLHYLRELRRYEVDNSPSTLLESLHLKKLEFKLFSEVDVILTPSSYEERVIKESFPNKNVFTILPYFYEFEPENTPVGIDFFDREGILFLGAFNHMPNVDGVLWFVHEILPRVRARLPGVTLTVVGSYPSPEIMALQDDGLLVMGYVPDLVPFFEKARVFVAPLRYGAGIKGKIVTSMKSGVPVVTTSIGNEGLGLANEREALIADDPEAFALKTIDLYTNKALWERIAHGGKTYVCSHFDRQKARQLMETIMGINGK